MKTNYGKLIGKLFVFCAVLLCLLGSGTVYAEEKLEDTFILNTEKDDNKEPVMSSLSFILEDNEGNKEEYVSENSMLEVELLSDRSYTLSLKANQEYTMSEVKFRNNGEYPADLETEEPVVELFLQKKDAAEDKQEDKQEEKNEETADNITIYTIKDGKALAGSAVRLFQYDDKIPTVLRGVTTDAEGKYVFSGFQALTKYEIRMENRGLKFDHESIIFQTDKDGKVNKIAGKPIQNKDDAVIRFTAYEKNSEALPTTDVVFFVVDKDTGEFVSDVELTANTLSPNLSSYKNVKSDSKGMVNFKLEGEEGGKLYSVCVSKNAQFLWKFEPEQIIISVDGDGNVSIDGDIEPTFHVKKEDRSYLRDDLKNAISDARRYLEENQFSNAEAKKGLEIVLIEAQKELDKPETIPYYVEGFIQSVKKAKTNLEQYLVKEEKKTEEEKIEEKEKQKEKETEKSEQKAERTEKQGTERTSGNAGRIVASSSKGQVLGADRGTTSGEWLKDDKGWWFKRVDESYPKNAWSYLSSGNSNAWFFFDESGYMKTGWHLSNGKWYFLSTVSDGTLGAMKTGWYLDPTSHYWYYFNPKDGAMLSGWQEINGKWYYFNEGDSRPLGAMFQNEVTADGHRVNDSGARIG